MGKILGKAWKNLSESERDYYKIQTANDKERYAEEKKLFMSKKKQIFYNKKVRDVFWGFDFFYEFDRFKPRKSKKSRKNR